MADVEDELDPGLAELRRAGEATGAAPMVSLSPVEVRQRITADDQLCAAGPGDVTVDDALVTAEGRAIRTRIYRGAEPLVLLVYVHGGGWVTGDLEYADEICRFLAHDAACLVTSVDYRLAPEHPFPAGLDDVAAVTRWALTKGLPVAITGDSAGANLAAVVAAELRARIAFAALLYPVTDSTPTTASYRERTWPIGARDMAWFFDHYTAPENREDPRVSPLRNADLRGFPRTHVVLAGHDPLHDEGRSYADRLAAAGVDVTVVDHPTLCHGFLRFTGVSSGAREARDSVVGAVASLAREVAAPEMDPHAETNPAYHLPLPGRESLDHEPLQGTTP